ncbi:MAG: hypothetical protein AAB316_16060 [Bacteroidota bacterium]
MKKALWLIAVLALAFAGDRLGGWLLGKIARESQFRYSRLYRDDADCDILFVGNSRGLIFYQPYVEEKTGLSTANLSYNGMPMTLAATLIKDHLDRHDRPMLLVMDISLLDKRMDAKLTASFNTYSPYSERISRMLRDSFPNDFYVGKVSHLYRYNSEVFHRALFYWKKSDKNWLLDRVISPTMQQEVASQKPFAFDFTPEMLASLADAVSYAKQKGVKVELVVNPYYPPFFEKIANLDALISEIEKATGLKVHNYANSIADVNGFGDYQHLNKHGSMIYLDKLMADGVLDDTSGLSSN